MTDCCGLTSTGTSYGFWETGVGGGGEYVVLVTSCPTRKIRKDRHTRTVDIKVVRNSLLVVSRFGLAVVR